MSSGSRADTERQTDNEVDKRLLPLGKGHQSSQPSPVVGKENGLEVNAEKPNHMVMSRDETINVKQSRYSTGEAQRVPGS